jgi:methylated-DNA-[protein]-cysteine S-methyltransferase
MSSDDVEIAQLAVPFGVVAVHTQAERVVRLQYLSARCKAVPARNALQRETFRQIAAYLADPRHRFDLPCMAQGTDFQRRVWREIARIPSGETRSYGELARSLASAARPVGGACGSNPIPLIVPCHRVVAAQGGLGGFMHSRSRMPLGIKRWLLAHEGVV